MDEKMLFPKTWEEFEKHYGFYDSKQAYMFGNTRLIPSFRVQQWLDHIDDINRKKQSQKNKMEQVAQMFSKKLDEGFMARLKVGFEINCKFTNEGLKQEIVDGDWYDNDSFLRCLLTGNAEIAEDEE